MSQPRFDRRFLDASAATERHANLQMQIMAEILSAPREAFPCAKRNGLTTALFWEDDMLILWNACERLHRKGIVSVLDSAADDLAVAGMWSSSARLFGAGYRWSITTLVSYAQSFASWWTPVTARCIAFDARELNHVHMQLNRAARLYRQTQDALVIAADPRAHLKQRTRVTYRTAPLSKQSRRSETGSRDTRDGGSGPVSQRQAVA